MPQAAFIEGATGRRLTWRDVAVTADALGAQPRLAEHRIGLLLGDPLTMAATFLGAMAAGITVAPLNAGGAPAELARQANAFGLSGVVTDGPDTDAAITPRCATRAWRCGQVPPHDGPCEHRGATDSGDAPGSGDAADSGHAALVMASSGTTGDPKLIPLTESQLLHTARGVAEHLSLGPAERGYSPLPLFHINGLVVGVLAALVAGSSVVLDRRFSRRSFWSIVAREQVTWLNLVPAIITVLAARGDGAADEDPAER